MARLCVRVASNNHPTDASLNALRTQPGDVVCLVDDSHVFSLCERTNGQYRIIDVPGVSQEQLVALVEQVYAADEATLVKRRRLALDAAALKVGAWRNRTSATKSQIDAITVTRA